MSEGSTDPYAIVLVDIEAQIERLQVAKAAILAIRGIRPIPVEKQQAPSTLLESHELRGMTIVDGTKRLLAHRRKEMNNTDIVTGLKAGGLFLTANDPLNTVGAVLTRRYRDVGDIVRVARGTWGLKEWYPDTSKAEGVTQQSDELSDDALSQPPG